MKAKLIIIDDLGEETIIEQDLVLDTPLSNMNTIEKFVQSVKSAVLPKLEQELIEKVGLSIEQKAMIKKKRAKKSESE